LLKVDIADVKVKTILTLEEAWVFIIDSFYQQPEMPRQSINTCLSIKRYLLLTIKNAFMLSLESIWRHASKAALALAVLVGFTGHHYAQGHFASTV